MALIDRVHSLAASVPADWVTAGVLLAAGLVTLLCGLWRRRAFLHYAPGVLFVLTGAAAIWPLSPPTVTPRTRIVLLEVAGAALLTHLVLQRRLRLEPLSLGTGTPRTARLYLGAILAVAAAVLFYDLGGYAGTLLVWEGTVVGTAPETGGFAQAFNSGQDVLSYTLRRLLWDDGILSAGNTSLFYGAPTYALFHVAGFSPWTLRCCAVLATLLSVIVCYAVGRRFFGPVVGAAAAASFGLSHVVLFYGRYGSSPGGTLLGVLLAVWCVWFFLDHEPSAWWMGVVCAVALYAATLQYSPARLVVLILLGVMTAVLIYQWRRLWWRRAVGFLFIIAAAAGVWHLQGVYGTQRTFLFARGEQFVHFLQHRDYIRDFLHREVLPEALSPFDKIELFVRVLQTTIPQYVGLLRPRINAGPPGAFMAFDPPPLPLYYAPLALFIVWGVGHSLARLRAGNPRRWRHACLLAWVCASTPPLLLTNRVDAHRMLLFVVPLSLWSALGIREAAQVMARAGVPVRLQHLFAAALALTVLYSDVNLLYYSPNQERSRIAYGIEVPYAPHMPQSTNGQILVDVIAQVPGPVVVGAALDHRELAWVQLKMLERARHDPQRSGTMLTQAAFEGIRDGGGALIEIRVRELQRQAHSGTVLLAPANLFRSVAAVMQQRGLRVAEVGGASLAILRIDGGATATGVPDEDIKPLPTLILPPTPTPIALATGTQVLVSTLEATKVTYGFAPPKVNATWDGRPIVMGGVRYDKGLGVHAWTRMTYSVPANATLFQAIVGLSDTVRECSGSAAVTFEVRDDKDDVLFDSGLIDVDTAPRPLQVEVKGLPAITLVVTDGGNGRDCDHANWAEPAFVFAR